MKKITEDAIRKFRNREKFSRSNTQVTVDTSEDNEVTIVRLLLHGNEIARANHTKSGSELWVRDAGWQTNTTKERLNGFPNVSIVQKNWVWYLNGEEWNGESKKVQI